MPVKELTLLQKLEKAAREKKLKANSKESHDWFYNKVRKMGREDTRASLLDDARRTGKEIRDPSIAPAAGRMYTYVYDAKHKDDLPYWDAFPLIFMVGPAEGGWYGINLHYLPPKARAILFDELIQITSDKRFDARTKVNLSYQTLVASKQYALFKPCFKHYLTSQLRSKIVKIDSKEWEAALFLPTANFQKASTAKVWADSLKKGK